MKPGWAIPLITLLILFATVSSAAAYGYWGAKPLAMGGAFAAVADDINAIQWNPAGLTIFNQRKQAGFGVNYERQEYLLGDYPFRNPELTEVQPDESNFGGEYFSENKPAYDPDQKIANDWWHFAIVDGYTTQVITAGLAFTGKNFPNQTFKEGTDYEADVAIAGGFADILSLGVNGKYVQVSKNTETTTSSNGEFDMDFGARINAIGIIGIGLVGRNIFGNDQPMIVRREVALGVAGFILDYAVVSVEATKVFDVTDVPGSFNFSGGAEGIIAKVVSLRGGFHWDQVDNARLYSAGAAYVDNRGELAYTFQGDVDQIRNFTHSIQLSIFFP